MPDPNDLKNLSSQLKKTIIFAESFKGGSSVDPSKNILNIQKTTIGLAGHVIQLVSIVSDLAKIVNNNSKKITSLKNISKSQSSRISGKNIGAKLPGSSTSNVEDNISKITKSVISIAEILSGQKKLKDSSTSYDRRKAEQEKRSLAESKLEKRFDGLKKAAEKILAPVKSLLDKIINFLVTVFLGRVVYKLLEWFGDPKNADKVKSIGRFLGDHWPKLLALYLTFGTSFGRFALGLTKAVASGAIKLAFAIAKLLAAKKVKGAMGAARFLGGKGGKIAGAVLGTAAAVTGAYALTQGMKGDDEEPKTLKPEEPKIPGYAGGGIIKIPAFKGGGFNFKGMFGGALGSSPEKPQEMPNGFVSGEKGVDKVPAMLSDGEFVMSVGAVQKYGVDTLEGMNAAGGGTNRPKMMNGKTYAEGGGYLGDHMKDKVKMRQATVFERTGQSNQLKNLLGVRTNEEAARIVSTAGNKVPDVESLIGSKEFSRFQQGHFSPMSEGADEKTFKGLRRIYQQHFGVGEEFSKMMSDRVDTKMQSRSTKPIQPSASVKPDLVKNIRAPIPASRAIVPYTGGGALRLDDELVKFNPDNITDPSTKGFGRNPFRSTGLSTRGVQSGFTGMGKEGFDAISSGDKFKLGKFKPQILGRGAYSAPTFEGAQRYAGTSGSLGGKQTAGGVIKTIVPGNAPRINFLEPQARVAPKTFDKGKILADKLLSGEYAKSPLANKLRDQLTGGSAKINPSMNSTKSMNFSGARAAGFIKGAKTLGVELLLQYFLDKGMNYLDAKRIAGIVDKASKAPAEKRDALIESVRKDLDKEKRHQKSLGGIFDKIIKMGGETGSEYMSKNHEALLASLGSKPNEGSAIKGGFGLKDQSFKDAPKTQIMTDDKGRPFIGYKSMKNGKLHYSRGPQPGGLSTNPLEAFGRAINPGAYKDNDAKLAMEKQRVAATNSLESYQKQGMFADAQGRMMKQIGGNLKDTQNDLNYRQNQAKIAKTNTPIKSVSPPGIKGSGVYSTPIGVNRSNNGGRGSSGTGSQTPSFSARNSSGGRSKQETLGLMR